MPVDDGTVELARTLVEEDVVRCFGEVLEAAGEFRIGLEGLVSSDGVTTSDSAVSIPWSYPCRHTGRFLDVDPTLIELELRGMTFVQVDGESDGWKYHRFVDFIGALHQIGVTTTSRPMLTTDDYEAWDRVPRS
jgi:hypothetical protein